MKHLKVILLALFLVTSVQTSAHKDMKIGYVNLELVLAMMPETGIMNEMLKDEKEKQAEKIQTMYTYAQTLMDEYNEMNEAGLQNERMKEIEKELNKLDADITKKTEEADYDLQVRRSELLQPITEKLQKALDDMRTELGYTYILNSVDGSGVSMILSGPLEHDLTEALLKRMGVKIPE